MRMAICEVNEGTAQELAEVLRTAMNRLPYACTVRQYVCVEELLLDAEEGDGPDLLFVDAALLAEDWLCRLRGWGFASLLVLTAADAACAIRGYDAGAAGFLLRPYQTADVERILDRLFRDTTPFCLTVRRRRTITRVPYGEILFAESRNTKCIVHCRSGEEHVMYIHLDELEARLTDRRFLRCHQSYLVNMDHVRRVDSHFVVEGGASVSIRQRDLKVIRDRYLAYIERRERPGIMNRV